MCEAVCSDRFVLPTPSGRYPFPPPETFIDYSEDELKEIIPIGYRAGYFIKLARSFHKDPDIGGLEKNEMPFEEAFKLAKSLAGFGPYASAHLLLMAWYYNEIPIDTVETAYLKKWHRVRKTRAFVDRYYGKWGGV